MLNYAKHELLERADSEGKEEAQTALWREWGSVRFHPSVLPSEAAAVNERIPSWALQLLETVPFLTSLLQKLNHPLQPLWCSPGDDWEGVVPSLQDQLHEISPVLCVSASESIDRDKQREHHR